MAVGQQAADLALTGQGIVHQSNIWYARTLLPFDRFGEAERLLLSGQRYAALGHSRWSLPMWHYHTAEAYWMRGKLDSSIDHIDAGLSTARAIGATQLIAPLHSLAAQVTMIQGTLDTAREHIHEFRRLVAYEVSVHPSDHLASDVMWALAEGDRVLAASYAGEALDNPGRMNLALARDFGVAPILVRLTNEVGLDEHARSIVLAIEQIAQQPGSSASARGAAAHARALLSPMPQNMLGCLTILRESARPRLLAAGLDDAAEILGGRAGFDLAREASDLWGAMGIRRPDLLRASSAGDSANGTPAEPYLTRLTAAEDRVVSLIVQGKTNREVAAELYLSHHTVDSHVRSAFTKAGVNNRVELTRWYFGPGEPPTEH